MAFGFFASARFHWLKNILWKRHFIGQDSMGNAYFRRPLKQNVSHMYPFGEKRWVLYKGMVEASKVPSLWHGWLHHVFADPPGNNGIAYSWQKPHQPNLTGTPHAFSPQHSCSKHAPSYIPWNPEGLPPKTFFSHRKEGGA